MGWDDQQSGQREIFQACGRGRRRRRPARPSFAVEGEGRAALWRADQSDRHSGSGIGRILDPSPAARRRNREPHGRCGFDRGRPAASASQDRCDRRRDAVADADGLGSRRAAGLLDGSGAEPGRRGSLKAEIRRELDRIAVVTTQLAAVERARDALIRTEAEERNNPAAQLLKLKGLGPEFASLLWLESLFRSFGNRRQVAAYSGLAPSPWQSGGVERD